MPEATLTVTTAATGAQIWSFVEDMDHWAPLLTGYQNHRKVDERRSLWTVKGELGGLTRMAEFEVRITEWRAPEFVAFELEGLDEPFTGSGSFRITAAAAPAPVPALLPQRGCWERLWSFVASRLVRSIFGGGNEVADAPTASAASTDLHFALAIDAGGGSGPILNLLLAPMLPSIAGELAGRIVAELDRMAAR